MEASNRAPPLQPAMEHILSKHWRPLQWDAQSIFRGTFSKRMVIELINQTIENPDNIELHRDRRDRRIKRKRFQRVVGMHGITREPCYWVTVILNLKDDIITAFPTTDRVSD